MPDRIGPYTVVEQIGAGSLGPVWRGTDTHDGQSVVLRGVDGAKGERAAIWNRYIEALPALRCLESSRIASIRSTAEGGGIYAFVEDDVQGVPLDQYLGDSPRLPPPELYGIFRDVLAALLAGAEYNLPHLRLGPQHVMIDTQGTRPRARLTGYGLGKAWGPAIDRDTVSVEQASFLAPEQWHPLLPVGLRTDVYATGALMFWAATGKTPFGGETAGDIAEAHLAATLPSPGDLVPSLPWELTETIMLAMTRHPADRLADVGALALLLEGCRRRALVRPDPSQVAQQRRSLDYRPGLDETAQARMDGSGGITMPRFDHLRDTGPNVAVNPNVTADDLEAPTAPVNVDDFLEATGLTEEEEESSQPFEITGIIKAIDDDDYGAMNATEDAAMAATDMAPVPSQLRDIDLGMETEEIVGLQATAAADIPDALRGIALGDEEERVGMAATEAADIPDILANVSLDEEPPVELAETVQAPVPQSLQRIDLGVRDSSEDIGTSETQAASIPDALRGLKLDD